MSKKNGPLMVGVMWLLFLVVTLWLVPLVWKMGREDAEEFLRRACAVAPAPEGMTRGTMRAMAVMFPSLLLLTTIALVKMAFAQWGASEPLWWLYSARVIIVAALGAFGLVGTIWLFNWPKFLVPPGFRHEKGALSAWSGIGTKRK